MKTVYIGSCVKDGGIHRYHMDSEGHFTWVDKTPMDRPMYMTISEDKMYVVLRAPFEDNQDSGVIIFDIQPDGKLANPSEIISTRGQVACHILVDNCDIYCANYISGSVIKLSDRLVSHQGHGPNPERQEAPHVHYVGLSPDGEYICVVDLGLDTIFLYDKELNLCSRAQVPAGHGCRHIIFSDDGRYLFCANELASTVSAFSYQEGKLTLLDTISLLPDDFTGVSTSAAIRYHNGSIYVSNRGHDSISTISWDGMRLALEGMVACGGSCPRDFDFAGDNMIITNEQSNNVCVRSEMKIMDNVVIPAPLCVVVQPDK